MLLCNGINSLFANQEEYIFNLTTAGLVKNYTFTYTLTLATLVDKP